MDPTVALEVGLAFLTTIALLYFAQQALHRNLQRVLHRLIGHPDAALMLYWALLFPGILLHELSHWLAAMVLGVRRYRFALWPRRSGRQVRLGAVELAEADPLRMSLIGAAPWLAGLGLIAALGGRWPDAPPAGMGLWASAWNALQGLLHWEWGGAALYLVFAVGNTMWPSPSDRAAWPAVGIAGGLLGALLLLAGPLPLHRAVAGFLLAALARLTPLLAAVLLVDLPVLVGLIGLNRLLDAVQGPRDRRLP